MRILISTFFAAFLVSATIGSAAVDQNVSSIARNPELSREQIERLYRLEQAFLACDEVHLTGHDLKKLDDAIAEFEFTSGLAESELETIYQQVEAAASAAPGNFCSDMNDASGEIRAIPASEVR